MIALLSLGPSISARQVPLYATAVDVRIPVAPTPVRADDGVHLVYELHLTNFRSRPMDLVNISIVDGQSGKELSSLSGTELRSSIRHIGSPDGADPTTLLPGMMSVIFIDLVISARAAVPAHLIHRFSAAVHQVNDEVVNETWEDEGVTTKAAAILVRPPLRGERWVAMNGLSNNSSHRRTIVVVNGRARIAQRFAADWTRLSRDGRPFHDDPAKNANWYAYGAPVYSVSSGTVVALHDGIPENDPTAGKMAVEINLETVAGNYVIVDIGGEFSLYAHLQPRSIRVKVGDRVRAGEVLALLGNSGNSDAPHLHFHICDRPSPLACEGLPYVFDTFDLLGYVPSLSILTSERGWPATNDAAKTRRREMPRQNAVVRFRDHAGQ